MGALTKAAKAAINQQPTTTFKANTSSVSFFQEKFEMAKQLSMSTLIPQQFRGKPADVLMAMELSEQMKMSLFVVTQNLDIIHGKTSWKSSFIISAINSSGKFKSNLRFEWRGTEDQNTWACRAWVIEHDNNKLFGTWVSIQMAINEGWFEKKGSKWKTMPEQMLQYRAASFFGRLFASDILMGMLSTEEIVDVEPISVETVEASNTLKLENQLEVIIHQASNLGFDVSGPTEGKKGVFWLKATIKIDGADINGLVSLGFKPMKDFYIMNVTHLLIN